MHKLEPDDSKRPPQRAIVLAAGRGKRLIPYTNQCPKPLLEVDGRPILSYVLEALSAAGVREVCLVVGYLGRQIESYVDGGRPWSIQATIRWQPEPKGTGDALRLARDFISAPTFVTAADYALPRDYLQALKRVYIRSNVPLAVSLKALPAQALRQSSSVLFDDEGYISRIIEKPEPGAAPSSVAASLIYIVPPQIRDYLHELPLSPRGEYELVSVINRMLADGYEICGLQQQPPPEWQPPAET
ncbi:MAG: nucleotidyltransferase family protein [Chloroflexota bacterium]